MQDVVRKISQIYFTKFSCNVEIDCDVEPPVGFEPTTLSLQN